jgi:hypothetical protein
MGGRDLTVDFLGERRVCEPGEVLTFGRTADLVIDEENPYLHRLVGRFSWHDGLWWIENHGQQIELDVESDTGVEARLRSRSGDAAPSLAPLVGSRSSIRFIAGEFNYQLDAIHGGPVAPKLGDVKVGGKETSQFGHVELTHDERLLLVALTAPVLRDPANARPERLPTNKTLYDQLGWSATRYNRKLDYLCVRLSRAGVRGLQGGRGTKATNRRWLLIEHAIASKLVTLDDLR